MKPIEFWNTCAIKYAHLNDGEGRLLRPGSKLEKIYKQAFFDHIDFTGKTVIDYGCGGAFVPRYLFEHCGLEKAICIDIANRSLIVAKNVLRKYNAEYHLTPVKLNEFKADVLICLACIQHFSTVDELDGFLDNVNCSGVNTLVLQHRDGETGCNGAYENGGDIGRSCTTNTEYMRAKLTNYERVATTLTAESGYQYNMWRLK